MEILLIHNTSDGDTDCWAKLPTGEVYLNREWTPYYNIPFVVFVADDPWSADFKVPEKSKAEYTEFGGIYGSTGER